MTDAECTLRHLVGIDVNMAFAAGANRLNVGIGAPTHVKNPVFDAKLRGSWLVDLSHVDLSRVKVGKDKWAGWTAACCPARSRRRVSARRGRPGTRRRPWRTRWSWATRCGRSRRGLRYEHGRYLDGWYNRLRDAYLATGAVLLRTDSVHRLPTPSIG